MLEGGQHAQHACMLTIKHIKFIEKKILPGIFINKQKLSDGSLLALLLELNYCVCHGASQLLLPLVSTQHQGLGKINKQILVNQQILRFHR